MNSKRMRKKSGRKPKLYPTKGAQFDHQGLPPLPLNGEKRQMART
jgi:hypothetical protein